VNAVALSHDGTLCVSGGDDMTIRVWNIARLDDMELSIDGTCNSRALCRNILYGHSGKQKDHRLSL